MNNTLDDLKKHMDDLDKEGLRKDREKYALESEKDSKDFDELNRENFNLRIQLMILIGTLFGSSIALSTGKDKNPLFILGEIYLFVAIVSGLLLLLSYIEGREWWQALKSKSRVDFFLIMHKKTMDEQEIRIMEETSKSFQNIMDSNQTGLSYLIFKIIPIEMMTSIFNYMFVFGGLFILASLIY